jgi:hypothetical protein
LLFIFFGVAHLLGDVVVLDGGAVARVGGEVRVGAGEHDVALQYKPKVNI